MRQVEQKVGQAIVDEGGMAEEATALIAVLEQDFLEALRENLKKVIFRIIF